MKLSIVTTLYYSAPYIKEFYQRIKASIDELQIQDYEIIFVDDGSPDNSLEIAKKLISKDQKVSVIELSRNFGHHKAMMTGLRYAQGDYVFLIDVDLEEEPELLVKFWQQIHKNENSDIDVIYGVQKSRKGKFFERLSGNIFYYVLPKLTDVNITKNFVTARLMQKEYVQNLIKFEEREIAIAGLWALNGFNQKAIYIDKGSKNSTTYSLRKKISMTINFITSLSSKPLELIFYLGLFITFFSTLFIIKLILGKILLNQVIIGWTSLIVSVWFMGGLIIFLIGVIGIYISKIFVEAKQRPYTIIKKIYK